MHWYLKLILILFGLAYFISPVDVIPDLLLPFLGWLDDGVVIGVIYYLIRYGKLPSSFFKGKSPFGNMNGNRQNNRFKTAQQYSRQQNPTSAGKDQQERSSKTSDTTSNSTENQKTNPVKTPYEILGISPGASKKEIQQAYKTSIKKYHPDKLSHLGKEFSTLANEKFLEIQNAYDVLMNKSNG